jgi:hypothetical protein
MIPIPFVASDDNDLELEQGECSFTHEYDMINDVVQRGQSSNTNNTFVPMEQGRFGQDTYSYIATIMVVVARAPFLDPNDHAVCACENDVVSTHQVSDQCYSNIATIPIGQSEYVE